MTLYGGVSDNITKQNQFTRINLDLCLNLTL